MVSALPTQAAVWDPWSIDLPFDSSRKLIKIRDQGFPCQEIPGASKECLFTIKNNVSILLEQIETRKQATIDYYLNYSINAHVADYG